MSTAINRQDFNVQGWPSKSIPHRLTSVIPPLNFGAVINGQVFRSAFPQPHNVSFVKGMNLKTILCLVETEHSQEFTSLIDENGIKQLRLSVAANKDGKVSCTLESIYEALLVVMDISNYPLLVHCNQGRHRTGCVIACMRRMQGWSIHAALEEYRTYSNPKARDGDETLIASVFSPEAMLEYTKEASFDHRPSLGRLIRSDLVNVSLLVSILASMDGVVSIHESSKSNSSKADSGVDLGIVADYGDENEVKVIDFASLTVLNNIDDRTAETVEVSIEECGPLSPPLL